MEAERYLRDLVRDRLEKIIAAPDDQAGRVATTSLAEVRAVAAALEATGAISKDIADQIVDPFDDGLVRRGLIRTWTTMVSSSIGGLTARAAGAGPPKVRPSPRPESKIISVIPIVKDAGSVDEHHMTAISVEIWSDGLRLRHATNSPEHPRPLEGSRRGWPEPFGWRVEDDIGTSYVKMGSSGHGGPGLFMSEVTFQPAPPADAHNLTLIACRVLDDPDARRGQRPIERQLGEELATIRVALP